MACLQQKDLVAHTSLYCCVHVRMWECVCECVCVCVCVCVLCDVREGVRSVSERWAEVAHTHTHTHTHFITQLYTSGVRRVLLYSIVVVENTHLWSVLWPAYKHMCRRAHMIDTCVHYITHALTHTHTHSHTHTHTHTHSLNSYA